MMYRSFVDLVFIILCALAVMLDQSIAVRGLRADPADVGNGGTEVIALEDMEVLVVGERAFGLGGEEYADAGSAVAAAGPGTPIVVVPESDTVSHHRVVETWWDIRRTGRAKGEDPPVHEPSPSPEARTPEPKAAEAPPPAPAKVPEPAPAAAVLAAAAVAEPAPVPPPPVAQPEPPAPAVAPTQPAAPPQAHAAAHAPAPVAVASAESPVIESGNSPAEVHAGLPRREAVVETAQAPRSDAIESQIERFEAQAAQLAQSAPRPVQMPVADAAPAQAPNPVMPAAVPAPPQPAPAPLVALAPRASREIPPVEFKPRAPQPAPKSPAFPWLKRGGASVQLAGAPAAAAVTPAPSPARAPAAAAARTGTPAPAVAAGPNGTPTPMAIRREPVPYQPVRFGGGGKAERREVSAAFGQAVDRGAMSALTQAPQDPVARIAWGDPAEALRLLDMGRMALVTVDEDLKIVGGIEPAGGSWRRAAALPNLTAYSNRVRVVDHVAGFAPQAALCGPGEHLAVVVPVGLERRIDRAMDDAARREGLSRTQVVACYGRLVANPTGLEFQVERVERRNGT